MRALILILIIVTTGCSSKHLGTSDPIYEIYDCHLSEELCTISYGDLAIGYYLRNNEDNRYNIVGAAQWDNTKKSAVFAKIQRMQLVFAFFKDNIVVHTETAWIRGSEGEPITFDLEFETDKSFDSSIIIEFKGRITE